MPSPFDGIRVPKELVCDFFALFSRFEFALKDIGYTRQGRIPIEPAWHSFAQHMAGEMAVEHESELSKAIGYLVGEPPMIQVGPQRWDHSALHGATEIEQAIDAARRVRHNLFHGGKHSPHSPDGRDTSLIEASSALLRECLSQNEPLNDSFHEQLF